MLGDLLRLIRTEGPLQWELAFQLATSVAAGDEPDPNPDPIARIRFEELSAIAELHVSDVTGMVLGSGASSLKLVPTTPRRMGTAKPGSLAPAARPPRHGLDDDLGLGCRRAARLRAWRRYPGSRAWTGRSVIFGDGRLS